MKPLAHSKHSSRKPLPTITKVTSEVMESYGSRSQDDDRRRDSRFPILFYSAASFTGQSNGFLSSPPPQLRRATLDARQRNQTTSMRIAAMMESSGQHASSNNNGDFGGSSGELR
nr:hypothetical protein Itr_chr06CG15730 [Ipomoea trifida]